MAILTVCLVFFNNYQSREAAADGLAAVRATVTDEAARIVSAGSCHQDDQSGNGEIRCIPRFILLPGFVDFCTKSFADINGTRQRGYQYQSLKNSWHLKIDYQT